MMPSSSEQMRSSNSSHESTTCAFDLFFDIPHPAASPASCERAKVIEPPGRIHPDVSELYHPNNISKIPRFAFPDFDEQKDYVHKKVGKDVAKSAILNKFDVGCFSSRLVHHRFSLLLDSGTRLYAHVLRYLPIHPDVKTRYDVGRRCERAMVLFTRAVGGVTFYSSLLRTLQAIHMEEMALPPIYMGNHDFVKAFLHAIYKRHLLLKKRYHDKVLNDGLNFTQKVLHDEYTKITIHGAELYFLLPPQPKEMKEKQSYKYGDDIIGHGDGLHYFNKHDYISFQLPLSLQPGYNSSNFMYECEDLHSPILPLLRCLGAAQTIRVLSALLCEHRIIFVSKSTEILSACVSACTAMLAQGLLVWRHVQIPVLPPHLLRYLKADAPFIVGVLEKYCESVERLPGLRDALYIDLDNGLLRTLYMQDAQRRVPDLMLRRMKKNHCAIDELANDFIGILEEEKTVWESIDLTVENEAAEIKKDSSFRKKSLSSYFGFSAKQEKEKEENDNFFQQAEMFVRNFSPLVSNRGGDDDTEGENDSSRSDKVVDIMQLGEESNKRFRAYTVSNNEKGEETAKAALVCLFLEVFGDMGMYLMMEQKKTTGSSFNIDMKKFLHRKRQMGVREDDPMYYLLQQLTRSKMFEIFVKARIGDLEKKTSSGNYVLISHTPLFALCQRHMSGQKIRFTTQKIREIVFTTSAGSPERILIDTLEEVRERALALTSEKPFDGNEVVALTTLIDVCKGCCQSYTQVMQVVWLRIREHRAHLWKRPLLGLHLLRNFLLHGPIATLSSSIVELERIRGLMYYRCKYEENALKVQTAARQVYALLKNICRLFLRRRKVMALKVKNTENISDNVRWSSYLIRRLPGTVNFDHIHELMKPPDEAMPQSPLNRELEEMHRNDVPVHIHMNDTDMMDDISRFSKPSRQMRDIELEGSKLISEHSRNMSVEIRSRNLRQSSVLPKQVLDAEFEGSKRINRGDKYLNSKKSLKELFESELEEPRAISRRSSVPPAMRVVVHRPLVGPVTKSLRIHRDFGNARLKSSKHVRDKLRSNSDDYQRRDEPKDRLDPFDNKNEVKSKVHTNTSEYRNQHPRKHSIDHHHSHDTINYQKSTMEVPGEVVPSKLSSFSKDFIYSGEQEYDVHHKGNYTVKYGEVIELEEVKL